MWTTTDGHTIGVTRAGLLRLIPRLKRERPLWKLVLRNYTGSLRGVLARLLRVLVQRSSFVHTRNDERTGRTFHVYASEVGGRSYYLYVRPGPGQFGRLVAVREHVPTAAEPEVKVGTKVPDSVLNDRSMSGNRAQETVIAQLRRRIPKNCRILEVKQQVRRNERGEIVWAGQNIPDLQMICNGRVYAIEVDTKLKSLRDHQKTVPRKGVTSAFVKINRKAKIEDVEVLRGRSKRPLPRAQWGRLLSRVIPAQFRRRAREFEGEMELESGYGAPAPSLASV